MATLTGIDVLIREDFKALQGQRVGLITNHTGLTADGISTIDVLHQAPGVELAAAIRDLFRKNWKIEDYDRVLVNRQIFEAFRRGASYEELLRIWRPSLEAFIRVRAKYLLYA